jgi:hypothetical protein
MKQKLLLIAIMLFAVIQLTAQKPFEGFFKPITKKNVTYVAHSDIRSLIGGEDYRDIDEIRKFIFRPAATITAVAIDFEGNSQSFSSFGFGVSYGKFSVVDDTPYCNYSFNALVLTGMELGGEQKTSIGGALTVDVFNKIIGAGFGYIDNKVMFLTTLSYSF